MNGFANFVLENVKILFLESENTAWHKNINIHNLPLVLLTDLECQFSGVAQNNDANLTINWLKLL